MGLISKWINMGHPYIYLEDYNWEKSQFNVRGGYEAALSDFNSRALNALKMGSVPLNRKILKAVKETLQSGNVQIPQAVQGVQDSFNKMAKGDESIYKTSLAGLNNMSLAQLKRADQAQLNRLAKELSKDSDQFALLLDNLEQIRNDILTLNTSTMSKEARAASSQYLGLMDISQVSELSGVLGRLEKLVQADPNAKRGDGVFYNKTKGINFKAFLTELKNITTQFQFHLSGAGGEAIKTGVIKAQMDAPEFLKKLPKTINGQKVTYFSPQVQRIGSNRYNNTVSKGDIRIAIGYDVGGKKGVFYVNISEKSSKIQAQSVKAKSMKPRLVNKASYKTIFAGVDMASEMYFLNSYVHNHLNRSSKGTEILKYLGARASTNILSGIESMGQAFLIREGDDLKSVDEILSLILSGNNSKYIDRYINLQIDDPVAIGRGMNAPREDKSSKESNAIARSQAIYRTLKNGLTFSATFGSRAGGV